MQATVSKIILDSAESDAQYKTATGGLIVPNSFRETINVSTFVLEQIELVELKAILIALKKLDIADFTADLSASIITSLTDADLDILMTSGSVHTTISNMFYNNTNINSSIPDLALATLYGIADIVIKIEVKAFIAAAKAFGSVNFETVDFDLATIAAMNETDRNIVIASMIVRNKITPNLVGAINIKDGENFPGGPFFVVDAEDYESNDLGTFFTYLDMIEAFKFLNNQVFTE
jgi:hypothetical protein